MRCLTQKIQLCLTYKVCMFYHPSTDVSQLFFDAFCSPHTFQFLPGSCVDCQSPRHRNVNPSHPGSLTSYCQCPDFIFSVMISSSQSQLQAVFRLTGLGPTHGSKETKEKTLCGTNAVASLVSYQRKEGQQVTKLLNLQCSRIHWLF